MGRGGKKEAIKVDPPGWATNKISFSTTSSGSSAVASYREVNEDSFLQEEETVAVFDGMGGPGDGNRAALAARDSLQRALVHKPGASSIQALREWLIGAVLQMELDVRAANPMNPRAGTTATVATVGSRYSKPHLLLASIGDSRCYLIREGSLKQISIDDTMAGVVGHIGEKLDTIKSIDDLDSEERAKVIPFFKKRNEILDALGSKPNRPSVRLHEEELLVGDRLLLTSDGVHDNLARDEIEILAQQNAEKIIEAAQQRVRENSFRSKDDDITACILDLRKPVP